MEENIKTVAVSRCKKGIERILEVVLPGRQMIYLGEQFAWEDTG